MLEKPLINYSAELQKTCHVQLALLTMQDFVKRKHKNIPIEVETRTLEEVKEVLHFLESDKHSLVKRLMLDNMTKLDPSAPGIRCCIEICVLEQAPSAHNWLNTWCLSMHAASHQIPAICPFSACIHGITTFGLPLVLVVSCPYSTSVCL